MNRLEKGITVNFAGNNRLIPVERVTGEDFWILSKILRNHPYVSGMFSEESAPTALHFLILEAFSTRSISFYSSVSFRFGC